MSTEDRDNIYILEEENEDIDTSPRNFAAYEDEEREEENNLEQTDEKHKSAFILLLRIMFSPVEGWKKLRRSRISIEDFQSGCFYPILALLAVSKFADYFYSVNVTLTQIISEAIVAFVAYFFGFFCIGIVLNWILPQEIAEKYESKFGKNFTMVALSTLAIFSIITDLLPMLWPILIFLPIWTLYIMFKGVRFFKMLPNQETKFYIISSIAIIGIPLLIDWALNSVLPY